MTSKEKIENAWELINSKHIETNDEIQLVRFAVRMARELVERDTPMKVIKEVDKKYVDTYDFYERDIYRCGSCKKVLIVDRHQKLQDNEKTNYCYYCGQRIDWGSGKKDPVQPATKPSKPMGRRKMNGEFEYSYQYLENKDYKE